MIEKTNLDKTNAWPFVEAKKLLRERKVQIELNGWFQSKNEKMKGDLKMNGIYRTLITNISPTQTFPVIMDIPETVWNEIKMSTKEEV